MQGDPIGDLIHAYGVAIVICGAGWILGHLTALLISEWRERRRPKSIRDWIERDRRRAARGQRAK
jgi:hypothetical protein